MNTLLAMPAELVVRTRQLVNYVVGIMEVSRVRPSERADHTPDRKENAMVHLKSFTESHPSQTKRLTSEQLARIEQKLSTPEGVSELNAQSIRRYDQRLGFDEKTKTDYLETPAKPLR